MSSSGARDIVFRMQNIPWQLFLPIKSDILSPGTSIAACNASSHLRVYMQDVMGKIRETSYEDKWSNGTEKNVIVSAKLYSPLACTSNDLENVSLLRKELSKG